MEDNAKFYPAVQFEKFFKRHSYEELGASSYGVKVSDIDGTSYTLYVLLPTNIIIKTEYRSSDTALNTSVRDLIGQYLTGQMFCDNSSSQGFDRFYDFFDKWRVLDKDWKMKSVCAVGTKL